MKPAHLLALGIVAPLLIGCAEHSDAESATVEPATPIKLHYYVIGPT